MVTMRVKEFAFSKGWISIEEVVNVIGQDIGVNVMLSPASAINTSTLSTLLIYPNPTQGEVTIKIPTKEKVNTFEIYNITRALVYNKIYNASPNEVKLNINQPRGVYIVKVALDNGKVSIGKLIVK